MVIKLDAKVGIGYQRDQVPDANLAITYQRQIGQHCNIGYINKALATIGRHFHHQLMIPSYVTVQFLCWH